MSDNEQQKQRSKFTGEHPCRSVISLKLQSNFIEIALRHRCSPVNLLHIFRTPFPKNTSGWLQVKYSKVSHPKKIYFRSYNKFGVSNVFFILFWIYETFLIFLVDCIIIKWCKIVLIYKFKRKQMFLLLIWTTIRSSHC